MSAADARPTPCMPTCMPTCRHAGIAGMHTASCMVGQPIARVSARGSRRACHRLTSRMPLPSHAHALRDAHPWVRARAVCRAVACTPSTTTPIRSYLLTYLPTYLPTYLLKLRAHLLRPHRYGLTYLLTYVLTYLLTYLVACTPSTTTPIRSTSPPSTRTPRASQVRRPMALLSSGTCALSSCSSITTRMRMP